MKSRLTLLVAVAIMLASCNTGNQLTKSTSSEVILNQENIPLTDILEEIVSQEFSEIENVHQPSNDFTLSTELNDSTFYTGKIENELDFNYQNNPSNNPNCLYPNQKDYYLYYDFGTNGPYYSNYKPNKNWQGDYTWNKNTSPSWYRYFYKKQYYLGKKHLMLSRNSSTPFIRYGQGYAYDNYRDNITRNYGRINRYYHAKPTPHNIRYESVNAKGEKVWIYKNGYNGYTGTYGYTGYEFEFKTYADSKKVKRDNPEGVNSDFVSGDIGTNEISTDILETSTVANKDVPVENQDELKSIRGSSVSSKSKNNKSAKKSIENKNKTENNSSAKRKSVRTYRYTSNNSSQKELNTGADKILTNSTFNGNGRSSSSNRSSSSGSESSSNSVERGKSMGSGSATKR